MVRACAIACGSETVLYRSRGLVARLGGQTEAARELAYRLYNVCERRKRAQEALGYNALVISWPEIAQLAQAIKVTEQAALF